MFSFTNVVLSRAACSLKSLPCSKKTCRRQVNNTVLDMDTVRAADAQYDYAGSGLQASTNKTVKNEKCSEAILAHFFY